MSIGIIEIEHDDLATRTIVGKKTGEEFHIREQTGWFKVEGSKYPKEITFEIPRDKEPYARGIYEVTNRNLSVNRYGKLEMSRALWLEATPD